MDRIRWHTSLSVTSQQNAFQRIKATLKTKQASERKTIARTSKQPNEPNEMRCIKEMCVCV